MNGYPKLSKLMGSSPAVTIFRRFSTLNIQNLLYLQAEINELEDEINEIAREDNESHSEQKKLFSTQWEVMANASDGDRLQWEKWLEIRSKLDQYNAALLQVEQIFKISRADDQDIQFLRTWLERPKSGDRFLRGLEADIWAPKNTLDLVTLQSRFAEKDILTAWIVASLLPFFHRYLGHRIFKSHPGDEEAGIIEYEDSKLIAILDIFGTVLSSAMPLTSIVALYYINDVGARLAAVAVFTLAFSMVLAIFTKARRIEIFAATAAFASVQVVFVGSTTNLTTS